MLFEHITCIIRQNFPLFLFSVLPMTKKGFFKKYDYVYDEYYDCMICPANEILRYSTTNREGYREYKSDPEKCSVCPFKEKCTESKTNQKIVVIYGKNILSLLRITGIHRNTVIYTN